MGLSIVVTWRLDRDIAGLAAKESTPLMKVLVLCVYLRKFMLWLLKRCLT
jgi:hypothetical protein